MPRKARLSVPGAVTHAMARCIDGRYLLTDDEDGRFFVNTLSRCLIESSCPCYAWALMKNHYHVLLRLGEGELWETFKPLNTQLAQFHNRKYGRRGPLFMDRFKSIVTQDQNYIEELVRYVHLNPLRAGLCKVAHDLHHYPWSGHRAILGLDTHQFQDTQTVLRLFGRTGASAQKAYLAFLSEGAAKQDSNDIVAFVRSSNDGSEKGEGPRRWVIGDPDFVRKVVTDSRARKLRLSRFQREGADFTPIALTACKAFAVTREALLRRHRGGPASDARRCFCFIAVRCCGARGTEVARYLGIHPTAVSAMLRKGRKLAETKGLLSI